MATTTTEVQLILEHLAARHESLAVAESLTGGALGAAITSVAGASRVFLGGTISYHADIKVNQLGVPREIIDSCGVVSEEVAAAMALGARKLFGSTWAISTTGVAGPADADGIAAGTVWISISGPINHSALLDIQGGREVVRNATVSSAIAAFERILSTRR
ncbi:MAG: CinA family protein [Actinobacteria bacterium]|nr:CinA family protein [Actinomycetota bacterium]